MCGACGRTVVPDPILGPIRTMRQHLIVAQTINWFCKSWPGAPKVAATSDGWLLSGQTGATAAVGTVEALWSAVLRSGPGVRSSDLRPTKWHGAPEEARMAAPIVGSEGDPTSEDWAAAHGQPEDLAAAHGRPEDLSLRVLNLGRHMARNAGTNPGGSWTARE